MAIRNILTKEDSFLYKKSRKVVDFNDRLSLLIDDMKETLIASGGVGLAAPQIGVLRNVVVILETNVEENEDEYIIEMINPEIIEYSGEQTGPEGCLSAPGEYGLVTRPEFVTVRAQNRKGMFFNVSCSGLTARCVFHEIDHLSGTLFLSKCIRMLTNEEMENGNF